MQAIAAIECVEAVSGELGSFLYQRISPDGKAIAISPIFSHCRFLFDWVRENGWKPVSSHFNSGSVGTYKKELHSQLLS